jgi:hypothetical protein
MSVLDALGGLADAGDEQGHLERPAGELRGVGATEYGEQGLAGW